jgi:hypothetical protein
MDVIAKQTGYYGGKVVEVGERFTLAKADDYSELWMDKAEVNEPAPEPKSKRRGYEPSTVVTPPASTAPVSDPISGPILAVTE